MIRIRPSNLFKIGVATGPHIRCETTKDDQMKSVTSWLRKLSTFDHRKAQRLKSPLLVAYYWDGAAPTAHGIHNISSTGFYLLTKERWHPGTVVTITLQRTDVTDANTSSDGYISVLSKVIRTGEDGVGFAFVPSPDRGSNQTDGRKRGFIGKKSLDRFVEKLKSDQGHVAIGISQMLRRESLLEQKETPAMHGGNVMKILTDESGQAMVISVLCMTCLLGFAALAADVGIMTRDKRMAQTAADGAAVAGASELAFGAAQVTSVGQAAAALNGYSNGANGVTVSVYPGPLYGPHAGNAKYVEAIVSQVQPTLFMGMFGVASLTPTARAVATQGVTTGCIVTLGQTGTDISVIGNADITVKTCGIADDSNSLGNSKTPALYLQGSATLTANSIGITGGYGTTGNVSLTPANPSTGMTPVSDPLAAQYGSPPVPKNCIDVPAAALAGTISLAPGCYNGISLGNTEDLKLTSGQFVINGDLSLKGTSELDGSAGVQLVLYGATSMGGSTTLDLTGIKADPYDGLVIWQPASNTNPIQLIGTPGSTLSGVVYAPAAAVSLQGNAGATITLNFVVGSLALQGNATLQDYNSVNPSNVLTVARLVE
jgi:Flp pilus assembly protein TadG